MTPATPPPCPFTGPELAWLWTRYQRCTFPCASFPKRFARNTFAQLTQPKGWNMAAHLAYQYRRQIFHKAAAKWSLETFIEAVKQGAAPTK